MKKKIIGILACGLLIATALPVIGNENISDKDFDEVIDQDFSDCGNYGMKFYKDYPKAQSFKPSLETLTKIDIPFFAYGTPPKDSKITIFIKSDLKSEDILTSLTVIANQIKSITWIEFNIMDISVIPETTYYIVCCSTTEDSEDNYYCWVTSPPNTIYSRGDPFYWLKGSWFHNNAVNWDYCFRTYGILEDNNAPQAPSRPTGTVNGKLNANYTYSTSTIDPENDRIYYLWNWGDGRESEWIGPYESGEICVITNMWHSRGKYNITVKSKDRWGHESDWSDPLLIIMPYPHNTPMPQFSDWLFQRFSKGFLLLRQVVR